MCTDYQKYFVYCVTITSNQLVVQTTASDLYYRNFIKAVEYLKLAGEKFCKEIINITRISNITERILTTCRQQVTGISCSESQVVKVYVTLWRLVTCTFKFSSSAERRKKMLREVGVL